MRVTGINSLQKREVRSHNNNYYY